MSCGVAPRDQSQHLEYRTRPRRTLSDGNERAAESAAPPGAARARSARARLAGHKFFEQQRLGGDDFRALAEAHDQCFIAQGQQTRGLQSDDGNALAGEWSSSADQSSCSLRLGALHHAAAQVRAAAAIMPPPASRVHARGSPPLRSTRAAASAFSRSNVPLNVSTNSTTAFVRPPRRPRVRAAPLEPMSGPRRCDARTCRSASAAASASPTARAAASLSHFAPGSCFAQIRQPGHAAQESGVVRQPANHVVLERVAVPRLVVREKFDLHPRHVHARRTLALAALATDAQIHGVAYTASLVNASAPSCPDSAKPQRVGAPARDVLLVARDPIARTHRAGVELAALAVVVAHLDGFRKAAGVVAAAARRRDLPRSVDRFVRSKPTNRAPA